MYVQSVYIVSCRGQPLSAATTEAAAMLHGRYYNYSDAWMAVAIASHRFRLSGLMDACLAGIHFFTQYSLLIFSEI